MVNGGIFSPGSNEACGGVAEGIRASGGALSELKSTEFSGVSEDLVTGMITHESYGSLWAGLSWIARTGSGLVCVVEGTVGEF